MLCTGQFLKSLPCFPPSAFPPAAPHHHGWLDPCPIPSFVLEFVIVAGAVTFAAWVPLAAFAHFKSTIGIANTHLLFGFSFLFCSDLHIENGAIMGTLSFYCFFFYFLDFYFLLPRTQFRALNSSLLTSLLSLQILHCNFFLFLFLLSYKMCNSCEF